MSEKKTKLDDLSPEELRERALRPFKPSITDDDIKAFEEEIRQQSLETMKRQKDSLNAYDREKIKDRSSFEHHI